MILLAIAESAERAARLLEAAAPKRGLLHARHQKTLKVARRKIKALISNYFERQGNALLRDVSPRIQAHLEAYPPPFREAATPGGKRFSNALLPSSLSPLTFPVTGIERSEWDAAITAAIQGAAKTLAAELKASSTLRDDAVSNYLRENSLTKLTGGLAETSVDRLRNAIADAWDKGGSFNQITSAVKDTFADFSTARAETIAQTETNSAYNAGRMAMADEIGATEKAWETESGDPCEICLANEAQGYIPIDEDFESGDDMPLAHVNCACSLNFQVTHESD